MKNICVVGLGYIGLPTASLMATKGLSVLGVDVNPTVIEAINRGETHITEPDLDLLVKSAVHSGHLKAALEPAPSEAFIIAVPTPFKAGHAPDLGYIESAVKAIIPHVAPGNLVILESTSPVGTTDLIGEMIETARPDLQALPSRTGGSGSRVYLAHCPERVLPGRIIRELVDNDRIIGGVDPESAERARTLYEQFTAGRIFLTNARTAEMAKLAENAFRDVNIAFANELSLICRQLGVDIWELIGLANRHPRVKILEPGPGVGGHCIAVDPWFIVHSAPDLARLLRTAREVNDGRPDVIVAEVKDRAGKLVNPDIACLGLSYKADVGDLRESPAVAIVKKLASWTAGTLLVVEPHINTLPATLSREKNVVLAGLDEALSRAKVVVLLVNHRTFLSMDRTRLAGKVLVDTRGAWR